MRFNLCPMKITIFVLCSLYSATLSANQTCRIISEIPENYIPSDGFDLIRSTERKGHAIQVCQIHSGITLERVGPIYHLLSENVSYFVSEHLCYGEEGSKVEKSLRERENIAGDREIGLTCEIGNRVTRMCSRATSLCDFASLNDFVSTIDISATQFNKILDSVRKLKLEKNTNLNERFPNLDQKGLAALEKFIGFESPFNINVVRFYDYSSFIHPGLFRIAGSNRGTPFSLIVGFNKGEMLLVEVGIPDH